MDFQIRTLIKQFLTKYQIFKKLPQISHIHKNRNFKSIETNCFFPINSMAGTRKECTFFVSFEPLKYSRVKTFHNVEQTSGHK